MVVEDRQEVVLETKTAAESLPWQHAVCLRNFGQLGEELWERCHNEQTVVGVGSKKSYPVVLTHC
jgi:hypothetical protein